MNTARKIITHEYEILKEQLGMRKDLEDEDSQVKLYIDSHINITVNIAKLLNAINTKNDQDVKYRFWLLVFRDMLIQCYIRNVEPKKAHTYYYNPEVANRIEFTFKTIKDYKEESLTLVNVLEGYLTTQVTESEPLWWIEVGNKLNITNIIIEKDGFEQ